MMIRIFLAAWMMYAGVASALEISLSDAGKWNDYRRNAHERGLWQYVTNQTIWCDNTVVHWPDSLLPPSEQDVDYSTNSTTTVDYFSEVESRPVEFHSGTAIPDSASTNPVYEIGVDNGALVTWVAHASPYDPAVAESNRVAALTERSTLRSDLRVLKGVAQTNKAHVQAVVPWTNGVTAGQQRSDFNNLRRELIDANDTIIELTRLVRQLLKESD